jgi:hypothetical protein
VTLSSLEQPNARKQSKAIVNANRIWSLL